MGKPFDWHRDGIVEFFIDTAQDYLPDGRSFFCSPDLQLTVFDVWNVQSSTHKPYYHIYGFMACLASGDEPWTWFVFL